MYTIIHKNIIIAYVYAITYVCEYVGMCIYMCKPRERDGEVHVCPGIGGLQIDGRGEVLEGGRELAR